MVLCRAGKVVECSLFWRRLVAWHVEKAGFFLAAAKDGEAGEQRERAGVVVGRGRASERRHKLPVLAKDLGGMQGETI